MNKVDFTLVIVVNNANPNGDPGNENYPRVDMNQHGEISDVCIKRKIRNRLMDFGHCIFVQSNDKSMDGITSLEERYTKTINMEVSIAEQRKQALAKWIDVRAFGQLFAYKGNNYGIRGPVTIQCVTSLAPISVNTQSIVRSTNGVKSENPKGSDTMGKKYLVPHALYVCHGTVNPVLAKDTLLTEKDVEAIKQALMTLFENDESAARPAGSMEVVLLVWHEQENVVYSSAKLNRCLTIKPNNDNPRGLDSYDFNLNRFDGVNTSLLVNNVNLS